MKLAAAVPAEGVAGAEAIRLREAASAEFHQLMRLISQAVSDAWRARLNVKPENYVDAYVTKIFTDRVIVENGGRYWQHTWTIDESNKVQLGHPVEVIEQFVPVSLREAATCFVESVDDAGTMWDVIVIRAGLSANGVFYPDTVLREAAPLFEGARVFCKADVVHTRGEGKDVEKIVGWLSDAKFVEGGAADAGRITARLNLSAAADKLRTLLVDAWKRGKKDLAGLSIDAGGTAATVMREGRKVRQAKSITKVSSVDVIVDPSAGGEFVRLVESVEEKESSDMFREQMIAAVKAAKKTAAKVGDVEKLSDEQLLAAYREAIAETDTPPSEQHPTPGPGQEGKGQAGAGQVTAEDLRMVEARIAARQVILGCGLPAHAVARLSAQFEASRFTEAAQIAPAAEALVKAEREYLAKFTESGHVNVPFDSEARVEDRKKKIDDMLDAFFDRAHKDHKSAQSFKECYIEITGDKRVTGRIEDVNRSRFAESVGIAQVAFRESLDAAALANVLGNAIHRAMIREYRLPSPEYDIWRPIVSVVPVSDFRTNERTRLGGYGDMPIVNQGAPYGALTSPTDEKATYAVAKRGGTEDITLEQIKNDDVGVVARIPMKLARASKRTLAKFVFDFIRTNPTIYDSVALYHASHGNLQTAALDATSLAAHRQLMLKQTEKDSAERLGIGPKFLVVPVDLEETSVNLFNRNTNNDKTFVQSLSLTIIPVWYWTDANDWATVADPMDIPFIEIGFLDGNEEPQLFVQDNPTVGSMFTHDKLTWKLRHIFGGNVVEFRGTTKAVVA